jgi:hypothetical protein
MFEYNSQKIYLRFGNICVKFRTFVCDSCKSSHQAISHRVKSISMSTWTIDEVNELTDSMGGGNDAARATWLKNAPECGQRKLRSLSSVTSSLNCVNKATEVVQDQRLEIGLKYTSNLSSTAMNEDYSNRKSSTHPRVPRVPPQVRLGTVLTISNLPLKQLRK